MFTSLRSRRRNSRVFLPGSPRASREVLLEPRALTAPAIYRMPPSSPPTPADGVAAFVDGGPTDVDVQSATESDVYTDTDFFGYTLTVTGQVVNNIVDSVNPDPPAGAVGTSGISISAYISQDAVADNANYNGAPPYLGYGATGQRTYQLADDGISPVETTAIVTEHLEVRYIPPPPQEAISNWGVTFVTSGFTLGGPAAPGTTVTESDTTDPTTGEVLIIINATTPINNLPSVNSAANTGGIPWNVAYTMGMGATYGPVDHDTHSILSVNYSLSIS